MLFENQFMMFFWIIFRIIESFQLTNPCHVSSVISKVTSKYSTSATNQNEIKVPFHQQISYLRSFLVENNFPYGYVNDGSYICKDKPIHLVILHWL